MAPKERFEMRVDEELLNRVDDWARQQMDDPPRSEAFRRLVDLGLAHSSAHAVSFSDGEKMLMLMMGDLYKRLEIDGGEIDPKFLAETINHLIRI